MKVTLLNTYDFGGAGTATIRIHRGLRRIGVDSTMLVQIKRGDEPGVEGPEGTLRRIYSMGRVVADPLPLKLYGGAEGAFSVGWMPDDVMRQFHRHDPDVLHLNWVGDGFFSPTSLADADRPIVWRLPDMWAFTGGCHYAYDCDRYTEACGHCPKLGSNHKWDLSRWTWRRKSRAWDDADITVVAPSTWLADRVRESSLLGDRRIEVIPNALDTEVFKPMDKATAREAFGLPEEDRVVLFGAQATDDPRKGFQHLREGLTGLEIQDGGPEPTLVVFGASEPDDPPDLGFETRYVGYLEDEVSLALLYSAADVMVVPSEYEGFGQTASEALACGTPVVAFDATGPSDIVDHRETGYLAEPYDPADLREGIRWVIADSQRRAGLSNRARQRAVNRYALETVAEQYREIYESACE